MRKAPIYEKEKDKKSYKLYGLEQHGFLLSKETAYAASFIYLDILLTVNLTDISSAHPPCQLSPKEDPDQDVRSVRTLPSACRSGGAGQAS